MNLRALCLILAVAGAAPAESATLRSINEIRRLSAAEAKRAYPVRIRGVVTALSGWRTSFFVQDATAGISVDREDTSITPAAGDEVVINGVTSSGLFAPVILSKQVCILHHGRMLKAATVGFHQLAGGQQDGQLVEVRGIIHTASIRPSWGHPVLFLDMDVDGQTLPARVRDFESLRMDRLIDAEVTVRGVCGTIFNDHGQFVGPRLFVNDPAAIKIEHEAPADPFAIATRPLTSLLQFGAHAIERHRIKVTGTVTYQRPGRFLYVQDGDQAVYVESGQTTQLSPGTRVEVVGFSAPGSYSPILKSAAFRVLGRHTEPAPVAVGAGQVIINSNDFPSAPFAGRLIRTRGKLIERVASQDGELLVLLDGVTVYRARLDTETAARRTLPDVDSLVEMTGVCVVRTDETREPQTFEIQLRSPADIAVKAAPPWWSPNRLLRALCVVLLGIAAALGWIISLRRRVHAQTSVIRAQLDRISASEASLRTIQQQLREALAKEEDAARRDFLTGLNNRRAFSEEGEKEILRARRSGQPMALAYLDLDNFKTVNDTLGHEAGDRLLSAVGAIIQSSLRATDVSARLGGDEFAILFTETDAEGARIALEYLISRLRAAMRENSWPVSVSIGAVVHEQASGSFDDLMSDADSVMYLAKRGGKDSLRISVKREQIKWTRAG